jgi:alkylated DNA nucleotide flippase Atl1
MSDLARVWQASDAVVERTARPVLAAIERELGRPVAIQPYGHIWTPPRDAGGFPMRGGQAYREVLAPGGQPRFGVRQLTAAYVVARRRGGNIVLTDTLEAAIGRVPAKGYRVVPNRAKLRRNAGCVPCRRRNTSDTQVRERIAHHQAEAARYGAMTSYSACAEIAGGRAVEQNAALAHGAAATAWERVVEAARRGSRAAVHAAWKRAEKASARAAEADADYRRCREQIEALKARIARRNRGGPTTPKRRANHGTAPGVTAYPARYAKGKLAVTAPGVGGFKSDAALLAEALGGRWSNRERAYIMSPAAYRRLVALMAAGWSATILGELVAPTGERHPTARSRRVRLFNPEKR